VTACLAQRVDRVDGGAGVRQADRDVPGAAQRGRGDGHVRIGPGERGAADPLQLHLQVKSHVATGADAVDVDPAGLGERLGDLDQDADVEMVRGVGDRPRVGVGDFLRDRGGVVVRPDVVRGHRDGRAVVTGHRPGQGQPQVRVAAQPDRPAEAHHACRGGTAGPGQFGDAPPGHSLRIVEDRQGDAALDRRQVRQQRPDGDQDADVRSLIGACLLFGHAARLPVFSVKSVVV